MPDTSWPRYGDHVHEEGKSKARRHHRALLTVGAAVGVFLVIALVLARILMAGASDSASEDRPGSTTPPQLDTAWVITPSEAAGTDAVGEFILGTDNAFTGPPFITTDEAWVALAGPEDARRASVVLGIDPQTGTTMWQHDLPSGLCGAEAVNGAVGCVYRSDDGWAVLVIDAATGEITGEGPATAIASVRTVSFSETGLLIVGEGRRIALTMVGPDGSLIWQEKFADIAGSERLFDTFLQEQMNGEDNAEPAMERPRWRALTGPHVLLWSTPGAAVINTETGDVLAHECRRATASEDHYYCATDDGIVRHELDGSPSWTLPHLDLVSPPDTTPARPVAVDAQNKVVAVDWDSPQAQGPVIALELRADDFRLPPLAGGTPEHYTVQGENTLVALETTSDTIRWQLDISPYSGSDVLAVGDLLVIDSSPMLGVDANTGEVLWERTTFIGLYLHVIEDETLATLGFDELARFELP
ncbi:PQQ-binding-like beta-propeller repeat protein [Ruania rhizosphaerae]|uniref:outer membrane protein assembly factor BamB family protein n=1 Tax=Ruania rhizosphaerae TaxID=1840413 RepID=UPI001F40B9D1|nr:PQQ-binding-like beta-propeller repeat protein [Ruania rhizosphaerae]